MRLLLPSTFGDIMTSLYSTTFTTRYGKDNIEPVRLTVKVRRDEYNACFVSVYFHEKKSHHRTIKCYPETLATDIAKKSVAIAKKTDYLFNDRYGNRAYKSYDPDMDIGL
jgi:hypothetical protein